MTVTVLPDEARDRSAPVPILQDSRYASLAEDARRFLTAGDRAHAASSLKDLRDAYPDDFPANRELGRLLVQDKDDRSALPYLEHAEKLKPGDPLTLQALTLAYYRTEDLDRAEEAGSRYAAGKPEDRSMAAFLEKIRREKNAQAGYIADRTEHFELHYDNDRFRDLGRPILGLLDDAYREIGTDLGLYPSRPVAVILYSGASFRETTGAPTWIGGLYDGKIRLPVRDLDPADPRLRGVIFHEYVHAVVRDVAPDCPTWLNEGLAIHFEGRSVPRTPVKTRLTLLDRSFVNLPPAQAAAAYAASQSAVRHLIDQHGMYRVKSLLQNLKPGTPFEQAFNRTMPVTLKEFERQWQES